MVCGEGWQCGEKEKIGISTELMNFSFIVVC